MKKGKGYQLQFFRLKGVDRVGGGGGHWRTDRGGGGFGETIFKLVLFLIP